LTSQVLAPISHGIHRVTAHAHERGLNRAGATPNEWRRRAPAANPGLFNWLRPLGCTTHCCWTN